MARRYPRRSAAGGTALAVLAVALFALVRNDFLDPVRPALSPDITALGPAPPSEIATPIRIPVAPLAAMLEASVPRIHGGMDERHALDGDDRTEIGFQLEREPFRITMDEGVATVRTTIHYALTAYYDPPVLPAVSGSCGTDPSAPRPRLDVALQGPVSVDRSWTLRTDTRVVSVRPASMSDRDRCRVTFLNVDLTDRVVDAARDFLEEHLASIDSLAAEVDVNAHFRDWWQTLQTPIQLTDSLWLALRPEAVRRSAVRGLGDSLEVDLALRARPTVVYGERPVADFRPLPPLDTGQVLNRLDLRVEARAEYDAAGGFLTEQLAGRTFHQDGRSFRLDSLEVFGIGGNRLAVEVRISGDVAARLYLVGTPVIDTVTGNISVPDLDFDVATRDVVLAATSWLREDELRLLLRERAIWPAAPAVDWMTGWILQGLNRDLSDDLRVSGEVDDVRILSVHALKDVLLVRVAVGGAARLFVVD